MLLWNNVTKKPDQWNLKNITKLVSFTIPVGVICNVKLIFVFCELTVNTINHNYQYYWLQLSIQSVVIIYSISCNYQYSWSKIDIIDHNFQYFWWKFEYYWLWLSILSIATIDNINCNYQYTNYKCKYYLLQPIDSNHSTI